MKFQTINFTCPSCGAFMSFSPAVGNLLCGFCETETHIEENITEIKKYDYLKSVSDSSEQRLQEERDVSCKKCGASFTTEPETISTHCPYCSTPTIMDFYHKIKSESLLSFVITQKDAKKRLERWVGSLWFAPTVFTKYFKSKEQLVGHYMPYWGYDSDTSTTYSGMRGDTYYVTVNKRVMRNGRAEQELVQEPRINWTPASGSVSLSFDDILVTSTQSIPRELLDSVGPWNVDELEHFNHAYVSGFEAEEYTTTLERGFEFAKIEMDPAIKQRIRSDIGGDQQQIDSIETRYDNIKYRNILIPIWTATFKWKKRVYRYAINGQTGRVVGDRPYSITKIIFAVAIVLLIIAAALYYDHMHPG